MRKPNGEPARGRDDGQPVVGRFTYRPDEDLWWWSDEVFDIHGLVRGEVTPSTEVVLRHMHPDDVGAAWQSREDALESALPFTFPHRIVTAQGTLRRLIAAGHLERDEHGASVLTGHLIDLTEQVDQLSRQPDPASPATAATVDVEGTAIGWSLHGLTPRETHVLLLIAQGRSNEDIARHLHVSINSVKTYVRTAYRKISAQRRVQAVLWVNQHL